MSFIRFNHEQLVNLNYALPKELIGTNNTGGYLSSTIINCNTRKYHGLLVVPQPQLDDDNLFVLLSSLDESIVYKEQEFNLGIHKYPGVYYPRGHKYLTAFEADPRPIWKYSFGGIEFTKEVLLKKHENRVMFRYSVSKCEGKVSMRIKPYLAFRNYHTLSKANNDIQKKFTACKNGAVFCLYNNFDNLYLQASKKVNYVHAPDWYYNILYIRERERGYDFEEDLMVPGYFDIELNKGDVVVFSAGTSEILPARLRKDFEAEAALRIPRSTFKNCLIHASKQFIYTDENGKTGIKAGLHWFSQWGRDTFISLPGLLLTQKDEVTFFKVIDDYIPDLNMGLFPNVGKGKQASYNSVDAPLWFIWALQSYVNKKGKHKEIWKKYRQPIMNILDNFSEGILNMVSMHKNGLIWSGAEGKALTWMDAIVNGEPVTPRAGFCVEINALWYNAVCFVLELASKSKDKEIYSKWRHLPELIQESFIKEFWNGKYLADVVTFEGKDEKVRSNQIIAAGLPYSMLDNDKIYSLLELVKSELLTPRGLRTLSPNDADYIGMYEGNQQERDRAYHQGTVWVWQLEHFVNAYLKIYGEDGIDFVRQLYNNFEPCVLDNGISTIAEIFDGDPPHHAKGAISQAWSVATLLSIEDIIEDYSKVRKKEQ